YRKEARHLRPGAVHSQRLNMRRLLATEAPAATILIRIVVGGIFLAEGIQKFLYPRDLGAGRFAKIGIPAPDMMGPFVGGIEIVGRAPDYRFANAARSDSAPHRYQRSDCFGQDSHFARLRFLGFFSYKASALWILEHDS